MKSCTERLGLTRSLVALSVSLAVVLSTPALSFVSFAKPASSGANTQQANSPQSELKLTSVTATKTTAGVLLRWHTNSSADNLGFNVYRVKDGQRTRVNRELVPGAIFDSSAALPGGKSYALFDRGGTLDSVYYIESVSLRGTTSVHDAVSPVADQTSSGSSQTPDSAANASSPESADMFERSYPAAESQQPNSPNGALEDQFAIAGQSALKIGIKKDGWYRVTQPQMVAVGFNPTVDIRNLRLFGEAKEVAIATSQSSGQFGASDYIEFYGRGLDTPTTDTRVYYLVAGTTPGKRVIGQIQVNGDPDPPPPVPISTPPPAPVSTPPPSTPPAGAPPVSPVPTARPVLSNPIFFSRFTFGDSSLFGGFGSLVNQNPRVTNARVESPRPDDSPTSSQYNPDASGSSYVEPVNSAERTRAESGPVAAIETGVKAAKESARENPASEIPSVVRLPAAASSSSAKKPAAKASDANQFRKSRVSRASKKRKRSKLRRQPQQERSHALLSAASAPASFDYTTERKDRGLYFFSLINGEKENFFGQFIAFGAPTTPSQTINSPNPDLTAAGPAHLEIALQGVNQNLHQISINFNGVPVGSFPLFFGSDPSTSGYKVATFDVPASQLINGANTISFIVSDPSPACCDTTIVDYTKLTYPHSFNADAGSLRFSLRGTQSRKVDGFATPLVRLIDYTDPFNVIISKPESEPSASGHAITVPLSAPVSKTPRLFLAIPQNQFDQPASLSLNQPSTLNQGSLSPQAINGADFLVVSYKTFIPSFLANVGPPANTSLLAQRQSQGLTPAVVDIEDVYDEFGYGTHGPQAIRDFLSYAATNWITKPRYVIFAGDATYDPRNYTNNSNNWDLVPTKLVDTQFEETSSDDWLTDFDNDGVGDIPVGRLPFRTTADATLIVSKIVNFTPLAVQSAVLIADEDPFHVFGFVETNDLFQTLLPPDMTFQRINRGVGNPPPSDAQVRADIIAGFNSGPALVSYSGHGNIDVWTGSSLFTAADPQNLSNGLDKLTLVVVMDCLNGYYQDPNLLSLSEAFMKAPNGGAVAVFASSGRTIAQGQHEMGRELYIQLYGGPPMAVGDAIKLAKAATFDIDVKRTWIFFGDPSLKVR